MPKVVGIIGGSISGNKGSEAMVTVVIRALQERLPALRFVVFSPYIKLDRPLTHKYPKVDFVNAGPAALVFKMFPFALLERILHPLRIPVTSLFKETRALKRCDILIDVAGISFSDGRELYLPFNVLTILPKMMLGGDVVKISQACGPFENWLNRTLARWLLPRCRYLAARGKSTVENLRTIGIHDAPECPDVTFLLNEVEQMDTLSASVAAYLDFSPKTRRLIGICPSSVVYKNCLSHKVDYIGINAEFVTYLVDQGYRVVLVPHSIRPNSNKLRNNDLPVIKSIMQQVGQTPHVKVVAEELDSMSLRKIIGKCDFFIASRFHSMISALAMGVPVVTCGWGHKYFEVLDMFGLRDYAFDYSCLSAENVKSIFGRLTKNERQIRDMIKSNLPSVLDRSMIQIDTIVDLLQEVNFTGKSL